MTTNKDILFILLVKM